MIYNLAILKNENDEDHLEWMTSCKKKKDLVDFEVIDITMSEWLKKVLSESFDGFLARPPGNIGYFKQLYDERIFIINQIIGGLIYPSLEEIFIYENKRMLNYWLEANQIPAPRTWIFYDKEDAISFAQNCTFPIVAKTAIGGGGSGVKIIKGCEDLLHYIRTVFSGKGIVRKGGANLRKGDYLKRLSKRLKNIPESINYFKKKYRISRLEPQKWFVIFQEFIEAEFEWRAVRIGDSYFAHKKLRRRGELFSGTSEVSWDGPSEILLNFVKEITDKRNFLCQAVDIFEPEPEKFLVNEMQCFWGSKNPHQMIIDGKPGRYLQKKEEWIFEEGNFNTNNSYDLRLDHVLNLLRNRKKRR